MVAFTPNRAYPYSTPTDPANVPEAIQALAESIDLDMQDLSDSIVRRPFCKVRSNTAQTFPADQVTEAEFDFVEIDTAAISNLGVDPTRLIPTSAGFWLVWGAMDVGLDQSVTRDLFLRFNGGDLTRYAVHQNDPSGTAGQMMSAAAMAFCDGVSDYFTMTFNPTGGLDDYRIRNKQMACWRLTNT